MTQPLKGDRNKPTVSQSTVSLSPIEMKTFSVFQSSDTTGQKYHLEGEKEGNQH